jgi:predicted DNA-binding protein (UPF0251 family)
MTTMSILDRIVTANKLCLDLKREDHQLAADMLENACTDIREDLLRMHSRIKILEAYFIRFRDYTTAIQGRAAALSSMSINAQAMASLLRSELEKMLECTPKEESDVLNTSTEKQSKS